MNRQGYSGYFAALVVVLLLVLPLCSRAQFEFTTNNGAITITGYSSYYYGDSVHLEIPATTNGYPVTAIGDDAFNDSFLSEVSIPGSITNIGTMSFSYCFYLTNIDVDIHNPKFASTNGVLFNKPFTTLIQFPNGLAGGYTVPGSVTSISDNAFANSSGLTDVLITSNVTTIGEASFFNCNGLTNITIPASVTNIGEAVFGFCSRLTNIQVNETNPNYTSVDGVLFDKAINLLMAYPGGRVGDYVIPTSVINIGADGFAGCSGLSTVTIGNNVSSIGNVAFGYCSNLTDIVIPNSVTNIGDFAFYFCSGLTNIEVNTSNPNYTNASGVLFDKAMTTLIQYPGGRIGGCVIPESVTNIGGGAFSGSQVTNVTIPSSITSIDQSTFGQCSNLASINIPDSVTCIGDSAFFQCSALTVLTIPDSVNYLGTEVFQGCIGLTNVTIGKNVASIGDLAFYGCSNLKSATMSDNLGNIGDGAFDFCSSLTDLVIPDNVTNIGGAAFYSCSSLEKLTLPGSLQSVGDNAFGLCTNLTSISIPDYVTTIGNSAFYSCSALTNLTIGNRTTSIGDWAFNDCASLTSVIIPDSVTTIGDLSFASCIRLTNLVIGAGVTNIGSYAFASSFGGILNLHQAYFRGNAPTVNGVAGNVDNTIFSYGSGTVYYVPGTTGWENTFGGWPIAGWYQPEPQILGSGYGFGAQGSRFQFTISWATNAAVVVEASTNLQNWLPVGTNSLVNGTNAFSDSNWTNYPQRFYRVRSQ